MNLALEINIDEFTIIIKCIHKKTQGIYLKVVVQKLFSSLTIWHIGKKKWKILTSIPTKLTSI